MPLARLLALALAAMTLTAAEAASPPAVPIPDPQFSRDFAETQRYQLGRPTALRFTPDGRQLFFLRSGARDATRRLYVFDTTTGDGDAAVTTLRYDMDAGHNISVLLSEANSSGSGTGACW